MGIEWSSNLATGVDWQDRHHKELFKRINRLLDAMSAGYGKDEVRDLFNFLDEYFVVHFEAEERAMNKYGYPETIAHLAEHTAFIDRIATLRKDFEKGASTGLVIKVQRQVVDWLINHIGELDKKLGGFIKSAETGKR
ncbi:MAG TPA: bacteriohemerythrin [Thermodesulfobacteriota bacterium]